MTESTRVAMAERASRFEDLLWKADRPSDPYTLILFGVGVVAGVAAGGAAWQLGIPWYQGMAIAVGGALVGLFAAVSLALFWQRRDARRIFEDHIRSDLGRFLDEHHVLLKEFSRAAQEQSCTALQAVLHTRKLASTADVEGYSQSE